MSPRLLFKALLKERLVAAAEEIFHVFESTIVKYEDEICASKLEIERLRGLLVKSASHQKADLSPSPAGTEDGAAGGTDQEPAPGEDRGRLELLIKEERRELWASQHEDNERGPFCPQQPPCWENHQEDTQAERRHQTHHCKGQPDAQDLLPRHVRAAVASTSRGGDDGDGGDDGQRAASSADPGPAAESPGSSGRSGEAADAVGFRPAASDFHCHLCDRPFSSSQFLVNHACRFHCRTADVLCAVCGETLESTENLIAHVDSHKRPRCCQVCGKHCRSSTSLKEHLAGHAGLKLHCCPLCGKECVRKGDLKIHMRIHTGEKPFCCSLCCKSFTHSGHLKKHLRSHTGERPHRCSVCGKSFLQSTHLKSHLGTHTQKLQGSAFADG